jgi:hypothetical protein
MASNCGTSSGAAHASRRLVNISQYGLYAFGIVEAADRDETMPGSLSALLVNNRAPLQR